MAEEKEGAAISILKEILGALRSRDERKAASEARHLFFWEDGSLKELRKIADGNFGEETIRALREKYEASEAIVENAMRKLRSLRERLGPSRIATQIDAVLNSREFGKGEVRVHIRDVLGAKTKVTAKFAARDLCRKIETLNSELQRLHRMIYD